MLVRDRSRSSMRKLGDFGAGFMTVIQQAVTQAQVAVAAKAVATASADASPDPAAWSIEKIERTYENQPLGNLPLGVVDRLKKDYADKLMTAASASNKDAYAQEILWNNSDFGRVLFTGGPRPPWNFLIRSPDEFKANLVESVNRDWDPNTPLRRKGIRIQHLGPFDTGILKTIVDIGAAGIAVSAAALTGGLSVAASEATGFGKNVLGAQPTIRGLAIGAAAGAAIAAGTGLAPVIAKALSPSASSSPASAQSQPVATQPSPTPEGTSAMLKAGLLDFGNPLTTFILLSAAGLVAWTAFGRGR